MDDKQTKLDLRYLRMARIWAENSYCKRRQVGALVVKDKMIISDGYNGTPSGFENVCEENDVTKPYVLHAEANASPSWRAAATIATAVPSTSPPPLASNVPSSSSRRASSVWYMPRNIDSTMASNSWREPASRWNISIQMKEI